MTEDLVKTGMCKINESPCQLQLEARCFIFLSSKGSGMVVSTAWTGLVISQSFQKNLPVLQFEESHSAGTYCMKWSVGFVCGDTQASALSSTSDPGAATASFYSEELFTTKSPLSIRPLHRHNSTNSSLSTSAASISSLILHSHPVHPLVR